jgi:predicted nucleic acid-binding protein
MFFRDDQAIRSLDDWKLHAGPKLDSQWKSGRSAMETARAWLAPVSPDFPPEVASTLQSHPDFARIVSWTGEPEVCLPLDMRRGETRNTDLLISARDDNGEFLIAVEAKADESFDRMIKEVLVSALETKIAKPKSQALDRAVDLVQSLLREREGAHASVGELRCQLFTGAVGVLREAERRGIGRAVLLIHEFVTDETIDSKHAANSDDLNRWLERVSQGTFRTLAGNTLVGPISVPGAPLLKGIATLYVGKSIRVLRTTAP